MSKPALERLQEKLAKHKRAGHAALVSIDLKPIFEDINKSVQEFLVKYTKEEAEEFKTQLGQLIRSEFSDWAPEYKAIMDETEKALKLVADNVKDLEKKQIEIQKIEMPKPKWFKDFSDSKILNAIGTMSKNILTLGKALTKIDLSLFTDPDHALAVKLVDKENRFYKAGGGSKGSGAGGSVILDGYSDAGDGTATITTAGVRVQLPNTAVRRVLISAHESNVGTVLVGGSGVVAALSGRRGKALFSTQSEIFYITNLSALWVDSTSDGDKVHYYYER